MLILLRPSILFHPTGLSLWQHRGSATCLFPATNLWMHYRYTLSLYFLPKYPAKGCATIVTANSQRCQRLATPNDFFLRTHFNGEILHGDWKISCEIKTMKINQTFYPITKPFFVLDCKTWFVFFIEFNKIQICLNTSSNYVLTPCKLRLLKVSRGVILWDRRESMIKGYDQRSMNVKSGFFQN